MHPSSLVQGGPLHTHMDASFMSPVMCIVCVLAVFTGAEAAGPRGAEGQTLIIRRCGDTGLSPLVGGRLRSLYSWGLRRERETG